MTIASLFFVWLVASVVAYLVSSPIGHNMTRLAGLVLPLMLLAASSGPIPAALVERARPHRGDRDKSRSVPGDDPATHDQPGLTGVVLGAAGHDTSARTTRRGFRVEVVPTANHWETYYFPRAGLQLARGWYRQLDIADNPTLYGPRLTASGYRGWLRSNGVEYVVVTNLQPAAMGATREARLVLTPGDGFRAVFRFRCGAGSSRCCTRHPS